MFLAQSGLVLDIWLTLWISIDFRVLVCVYSARAGLKSLVISKGMALALSKSRISRVKLINSPPTSHSKDLASIKFRTKRKILASIISHSKQELCPTHRSKRVGFSLPILSHWKHLASTFHSCLDTLFSSFLFTSPPFPCFVLCRWYWIRCRVRLVFVVYGLLRWHLWWPEKELILTPLVVEKETKYTVRCVPLVKFVILNHILWPCEQRFESYLSE